MVIKPHLRRITSIAAALGGVALYYFNFKEKNVYLSWTTNFKPSVEWDWNWDKREVSSLVKRSKSKSLPVDLNNNEEVSEKVVKPTATRHLFFIRHGQYNLEGASDAERFLTKLGREQADLTGKRLKALNYPFTRFVYSTMTRATETGNIILESLNNFETVEKCDLLPEGAPIPPEPPVGSWRPEMHKFHTDGARIEAAFRKYFHRASPDQTNNSYEIFVCHSNVIRYFVCRALQFPPEAWLRMSLHNCSITYMTIRPDGRVGLRLLGDIGFMPPDMLTFN